MNPKRNIGLIGSPASDASEVFAAILRHGTTPNPPEYEGAAICDGLLDWTDLAPPPYDVSKRKRGLIDAKESA